ncbi:DNA-binding protein [Chryseobacterium sp. 3008163]|nr:DNA-binding protein [Chryseobacterium sp. 3008163]
MSIIHYQRNRKLRREIKELKKLINEKCNFKELLTVKEACDYFGFSEKTFYRYREMGLTVIQKGRNSKVFVRKIDVEKFLCK